MNVVAIDSVEILKLFSHISDVYWLLYQSLLAYLVYYIPLLLYSPLTR